MTSATTTPKLYTSAAVLASPDSMYSGDMYPNIPRTDLLVSIECYGGRGNVPVDHLLVPFLVQVEDRRRQRLDDVVALAPGETRVMIVEQEAGRHVVVDDEHFAVLGAPSSELYEVSVAETTDVLELDREPSSACFHGQPLDDYMVPGSVVCGPEIDLGDALVVGEVICGGDDLGIGDFSWGFYCRERVELVTSAART
ncbi:LOW QUALITY PROTEIN: hypothetical protein V2J09_024100 [Rumex salicifolius]